MPVLLPVLQLLALAAIAAAIVRPGLRRHTGHGLAVLGLLGLVAAAAGGTGTRTLAISHRFSAYVGVEVTSREFPIETVTAPGWQWGVLCAVFCFGWAGFLRRRAPSAQGDGAPPGAALGAPLALALTGAALQLALQKVAAPETLLAPFDLSPDRVLFPASVAGAWLLARPGRRILHLVLYLSVFLAVTRLPLALFGTLATRGAWGTHLDVHGTVFFVPPGGGTSIGGIEVTPGSSEQLFWLIWAPHLLVYPGFYMMSTGGIAFLRLMWGQHREQLGGEPAVE